MSSEAAAGPSGTFPGHLIAHRGTNDLEAENLTGSLSRLDPWVDGVEFDVRLTADGVPVVMHDARIDRTTTASGEVGEMSLASLKAVTSAGERVPTLTEYLAACEEHSFSLHLIEMKDESAACIEAAVQVIGASPLAEDCVLLSSARRRRDGVDAGASLRASGSRLRLGSLGVRADNAGEVIAWAHRYEAEMALLPPNAYLTNRECLGLIAEAGLAAGASTTDDLASLQVAREDGVALILTNRSRELHDFSWVAAGTR